LALPSSNTEKLLARVTEHLKLGADDQATLRFLARGVYHENYVLSTAQSKYLVRVNLSSQLGLSHDAQARYEFNTLRDVAASSVTPKPIALIPRESESDKAILIEEFIYGREFQHDVDLNAAAKSLAKIHRSVPSFNSAMERLDARDALRDDGNKWLLIAEQLGCDGATMRLLKTLSASLVNETESKWHGIVHTDLTRSNFIVNTRCCLVDWECARFAGVEWDLAHFVAPTTTMWRADQSHRLSAAEIEDFLTAYADASGIREKELLGQLVKKTLPFIYFRCFAWCAGTHARHERALMPPLAEHDANRLLDYLRPEFIEPFFDLAT